MTDEKFDPSGLDVWTDETTFEVTQERLAEYAAATNDPIPAHVAGTVASPVFAIVPVFMSMTEPALEVVPLSLIGRIVHGEQDFVFHRPIRPGDVLSSRAKLTGWESKSKGTSATVVIESRDATGELVNEQYVSFFVRGHVNGDDVGVSAPSHKFDEALRGGPLAGEVKAHIDDDQTYRYSPASGDPMPIHLDDDFAKQMGLPGIIVHGLCTMAFTSWAVLTEVGGSDVTRLKRFAVRFAKPVLPGQDITTRIFKAGTANGVTTYAFESFVDDEAVITDGLAEIAD